MTNRYDNARTGANLSETILTASNVNVNQFGKLYTYPVSGSVFAQPLYVPGVTIPGQGTHNVLYVATMNDVIYAFDADSALPVLWSRDLAAAVGGTPVPAVDVQGGLVNGNIVGNVGIESTPVIDAATGTLYLIARTKESGNYRQRLHALDITTGNEKFGGPVLISASVSGTATGSVNGVITFDPKLHQQRPGLALANGAVVIAWSSHDDLGLYHGWVMTYNAATLAQIGVFCTTPNGTKGGIWQGGRAPAVDSSGHVYFMTGNGTFDGANNFGDSMLNFTVSTSALTLGNWFAPYDYTTLDTQDLDLGSSGPMLVPNTNLIVGGGKESIYYLINTANMGHEVNNNTQIVQSLVVNGGFINGGPVAWTSATQGMFLYNWSRSDALKAWHFNGSTFDTPQRYQGSITSPGRPGASLAVSANGTTDGSAIVWAQLPLLQDGDNGLVTGVLRAFDATSLREIWNSELNSSRDHYGTLVKFVAPLVVNGKVYEATCDNVLEVYGLLPPPGFHITGVTASPTSMGAAISWNTDSATTSQVLYGPTSSYGNSTAVDRTLLTSHSMSLDLACNTAWHYQVVSATSSGASLSSPDATFSTSACPGSASLPVSDDFTGSSLGPNWVFVSPLNDGSYTLNGSQIQLSVPAGTANNSWSDANNAVRLLQPVGNGDFEVVVKIDTAVTAGKQTEGIMVEQDAANFLRFDLRHDGTSPRIFAATIAGATATTRVDTALAGAGAPFYIKVKRAGSTWTESYSTNGTTFTTAGTFTFALTTTRIGVAVSNNTNPTTGVIPAFTGAFDYFHNTSVATAAPDMVLTKSHTGSFSAGGSGTYTLTAGNSGTAPSSGTVTVTDTLPFGLTVSSVIASGWACTSTSASASCTRSDSLAASAAYSAITLNVQVAATAPANVTNSASVSGGGETNTGNDTASDPTTITGGNTAGAPVADDFTATTLNPIWTFVNPLGDSSYTLNGTEVRISVPAGVAHNSWSNGNTAARISQTIANGNFQVVIKMDTPVTAGKQVEGIMVEQDTNTFLRFDLRHDGTSPRIFAASIGGGTATFQVDKPLAGAGAPFWLTVNRTGDTWTESYSTNGTTFTTAGTFTFKLTTSRLSLVSSNNSDPSTGVIPAFTAAYDFIH